jgi:hypothetical protein
LAKESKIFHDDASAGVRNVRTRTRARFEEWIEVEHGREMTAEEIWNAETIVERTKMFLAGMIDLCQGRFGEKIKASSLWLAKHCIYWYAVRYIRTFSTIYHQWHNEVSSHIHYIAVKEQLSTVSYEKNSLSDLELGLIFQQIMQEEYSVPNFKQHYAAMLLAWTTAARPGTFTVCRGYEKGAETGVEGILLQKDETLYWKDVKFFRFDGAIAASTTFRFHKGYRNLYAADGMIDGARVFKFMPTRGNLFEFDLALILFGLAFNRGLFGSRSLDDILDGDDLFPATDPIVAEQAVGTSFNCCIPTSNVAKVFVAADQSGSLNADKPMREGALNDKLQRLCTAIGLFKRNTYYSFRRNAIVETRRKHGTEAARDLAFHKPDGRALFAYDHSGVGDLDVTAMRLGEEQLSRDEVRKFFSQANINRYTPDKALWNLEMELRKRCKNLLSEHPKFIETEEALMAIYDRLQSALLDLKTQGSIPDDVRIPFGYSTQRASIYQGMFIIRTMFTNVNDIRSPCRSWNAVWALCLDR